MPKLPIVATVELNQRELNLLKEIHLRWGPPRGNPTKAQDIAFDALMSKVKDV